MYPDRSPPSVPCETPHTEIDVAEHRAGVQPDGLEEHLVEVAAAGDVDQRPNGDAWAGHRQDEHRDAGVGLGRVRVGPRQEQPELGIGGVRRPDLLSVDDPLVAVADGTACATTRGRSRRRARRTADTIVRRRRSAAADNGASVPRCRRRASSARQGACRCRAGAATVRRSVPTRCPRPWRAPG